MFGIGKNLRVRCGEAKRLNLYLKDGKINKVGKLR